MAAAELSHAVGISRQTLRGVECGCPSVTMGTYIKVMSALGVSSDFVLLAAQVPQS